MVSDMAQFFVLSLACAFFLVASSTAHAAVVEHTFNVGNLTVNKLCQDRVITAVNNKLPGPTIVAKEGDTVIVHVNNNSPYNITIHWHGIFQLLTPWADGPNYITQCPIVPGKSYTYKFNITGQEGTLWWHAHASTLRATVYGVIIIRPRAAGGRSNPYPFPKPHKEVPIIFGEWWDANVVDVENDALQSGAAPSNSDAYTINGNPGDLYKCSANETYKLEVVQGKTYMLRIINAALNNQLFFKIANHSFTVVAADASYTTPYNTDVIVIAPGQTVDALMVANASSAARYYMAARPYQTAVNVPFDSTTTTGIVQYNPSSVGNLSAAIMPTLPDFLDTPTAHRFYTNLTALIKPGLPTVPLHVNESMFVTFGLGLTTCGADQTKCQGQALAASMNNVSFAFPTRMSLLEAQYRGAQGIYTSDFPNEPPIVFDYTNTSVNTDPALASLSFTPKGTRLKKVKYGAVVEMVLQNTALLATENHPMHLHGFDFFVLAQGFGNYNGSTESYNLVNPQKRNTIAVPTGGWAVIRFKATNPGIWFVHCHIDAHMPWGLDMAFEVENGPDAASTLPPPPPDFPTC